jgi:hypothetical protein
MTVETIVACVHIIGGSEDGCVLQVRGVHIAVRSSQARAAMPVSSAAAIIARCLDATGDEFNSL